MKSNIASLVLVAVVLAMCLFQIQANDEADKSVSADASSTTTPATYFGVDANDAEAVRAKQRELSDEKFKELFGEDVHQELNRHEEEEERKKPMRLPHEEWSLGEFFDNMGKLLQHGREFVKRMKAREQKGDDKQQQQQQ